MTLTARFTPLIALLVLLAGCQSSLPVYELVPAADAHRVIADRSRSLGVVRVVGHLALTSEAGETTSADFATVLDHDRLKMRIWKFNTVVYDLTVTNEGVWVYDASKGRESALALKSGDMHLAWRLFMGSFFLEADAHERTLDASTITFEQRSEGETIQCVVDRRTLVARTYTIRRGSEGLLTMDLTRYQMIDGLPWPTRMTLHAPAGRIQIRSSDVSFPDIDASAVFTPSSRAERIE
jgi:hypothetical protein